MGTELGVWVEVGWIDPLVTRPSARNLGEVVARNALDAQVEASTGEDPFCKQGAKVFPLGWGAQRLKLSQRRVGQAPGATSKFAELPDSVQIPSFFVGIKKSVNLPEAYGFRHGAIVVSEPFAQSTDAVFAELIRRDAKKGRRAE
ncbi:hypothetical protein, partial [Klebsiella pneumoniae]|uniref:hypothetical protein n=1 Tax=Klebsiella pneumoniae TaxID=573 RepID=UPI002380DD1C